MTNIATIRTAIELQDSFSGVMDDVINAMNMTVSVVEQMQSQLEAPVDPALFQGIHNYADDATMKIRKLNEEIEKTRNPIQGNTSSQRRFNTELQKGADHASGLKNMIKGAVGAYVGIAGIRKVFEFAQAGMRAFDTQMNAETQLLSVLSNTLDADYISQFEVETIADTGGAVDEINAIQENINAVEIPVSAGKKAITAAYDQITEKAAEIQSKGIYGDEAMIAGAAEFSTYFSDIGAIEMMMDTLSDYAIGMSGGGEIDSTAMVNYATGLGKIMTGSYEAMNQKGFAFTDTQKAIIEGEASRQQVIATLGEEYADLSQDMQAAATISQVIGESWDGLYETMSNTPQGKMIQLNNLWGDLQETIGERIYPAVLDIIKVFTDNWDTVEKLVDGFSKSLRIVAKVLPPILEGVMGIADFVGNNWELIATIVGIVAGAFVAYKLAVTLASVAQNILNTSMLACPIFWVLIGLLALIVVFALLWDNCEGFRNAMVGAWANMTKALGRFYNHVIVPIGNGYIDMQNKITETTRDACINTVNWIADAAKNIIENFSWVGDQIKNVIGLYNSIVGTFGGQQINADFLVSAEGIDAAREEAIAKINRMADFAYHDDHMKEIDLNKFDELVDQKAEEARNFTISGLLNQIFGDERVEEPNPDDYWKDGDRSGIEDSLNDIAENTGDIADSLAITEEDLKYMRDLAERKSINRFTTAEIHIDMSGMQNTVNQSGDLDGFVSDLTDAVNEAVDIVTEGVHA